MINILKRVYGENEESGKYFIILFYYNNKIQFCANRVFEKFKNKYKQ